MNFKNPNPHLNKTSLFSHHCHLTGVSCAVLVLALLLHPESVYPALHVHVLLRQPNPTTTLQGHTFVCS